MRLAHDRAVIRGLAWVALLFVPVAAAPGCGGDDASTDASADSARDSAPSTDSGSMDDGTVAPADTGPRPDGGPTSDLPAGDNGIAARYGNDLGIGDDPAVIFADDFESYASGGGLGANWNAGVYHNAGITTGADDVYAGSQALEFVSPQQEDELSNGVARTVSPELDVLFLRYYSKFAASFDAVGSSHNGGGISAHYFPGGSATPGIPADGTNKFLAYYENWRGEASEPSPGRLNIYTYRPGQRSEWGDHLFPDGTVLPNSSVPGDFGPDFVSRPNVVPELGRWYCYELMVRANTPGELDGRIAMWLDGELVADFPNLRLRDVDSLTIDRIGLDLHIKSNTSGETRKWYDNVVAATSYIGPVFEG